MPQAGRGCRPACEQVIGELLADNALYRLRAAQGVIGLADRQDHPSRAGSRMREGDHRLVSRPTGPSRASWPPGAERDQLDGRGRDGGAAAFLRGPASFANVIPLPGTITSDTVHAQATP